MKIEKLEALERAATKAPFAHDVDRRHGGADQIVELSSGRHLTIVFGTSNGNENDLPLLAEARNALPALLAVAKAAQKSLDQLSYILEVAHNEQQDEVLYPNMLAEIGTRREELRAALSRLEAQ